MNKTECMVHLEPLGATYKVAHGTSLMDVLIQHGMEFPCGGKGTCGKCKVQLLKGNITTNPFHESALKKNRLHKDWYLACYTKITEDLTIFIEDRKEQYIQSDETSFLFIPEKGHGVAVDLGSTTIVAQLINLENGAIEGESKVANPQTLYGADLISRIEFALKAPENRKLLSRLVRECIGSQIQSMINGKTVDIRKVVMVGNSVMHHLFGDMDVSAFACYPFQSATNEERIYTPDELLWSLSPNCSLSFLPNISHFVGSDILAGIKATGIHQSNEVQIMIDLGTNGELVIGNKDRIICTSTAAGPAFEGINISQGMRAEPGAIFGIENNRPLVIGGIEATGICGSGLIDAIHYFLKQGIIDFSGAVCSTNKELLLLSEQVGLTERDIREFQLAKAAICTGIQLLSENYPVKTEEISRLYISGGMGHHIDIQKAMDIGLLEVPRKEMIARYGNSALAGAKMFLFESERKDVEKIQSITSHCSLETHPDFQDVYCEKIFFPDLRIN